MGVQDSDGEGEQRGRSNESAEWHHGQGGNAEKVVVMVVDKLKCKNHTGVNTAYRQFFFFSKWLAISFIVEEAKMYIGSIGYNY